MLSREAYDKFMQDVQKQIDDLDSYNKQKVEASLQSMFDNYRKLVSDRIAHEQRLAQSNRKVGSIDAAKYHEMMAGIFQSILDNTPTYNQVQPHPKQVEHESLTATTTSKAKTLSKSILILDDEYDIVTILKKSLSIAGFSVFGFTDPVLALEHFKSNSDKYEIVLTDVRMPQMNGIEFATHIRRISPIVKILMMSAFDIDDLNIQSSLQIAEFLQKPFSPIALPKIISKYMAIA